MKKKTILWLVITAIVLAIIGAAVFVPSVATAARHCTQQQMNTNTCNLNLHGAQAAGVVIGSILWVIAGLLWLVAWICALVRSAKMGSWVWFVIVLIFSGLGTLIYAIAGPADRPTAPNYPPTSYPPAGYPPGYQPGGYQPPSYPPPGSPPPYPQT